MIFFVGTTHKPSICFFPEETKTDKMSADKKFSTGLHYVLQFSLNTFYIQ